MASQIAAVGNSAGDPEQEGFEVQGLGKFNFSEFSKLSSYETYYKLKFSGLEAVISWCMWQGLIAKEHTCSVCRKTMKLKPRADKHDKFNWVCRVAGVDSHFVKRSIRGGSWFEESKLSLFKILLITCMWNSGIPFGVIEEQAEVDKKTITDWASFCREVVFDILARDMGKIGGEGTSVEIEESEFGKRKYNRGKFIQGAWVFWGVQRGTNNCFFAVVPDKTQDTLIKILEERVLPGTTVIFDSWEEYGGVEDVAFDHLTVNCSLHLEDPETGLRTSTIESTWGAMKRSMRGARATDQFDLHLSEYLWRRLHKDGELRMKNLIEGIRSVYPLDGDAPVTKKRKIKE